MNKLPDITRALTYNITIHVHVHVGIMLLEKQLLVNVGNTPAKSAKRSKGAQAVSEATETWVEASRYSV